MFGRIISELKFLEGSELQCLEGKDRDSSVYKNRARIKMFGTIRSEFQYL